MIISAASRELASAALFEPIHIHFYPIHGFGESIEPTIKAEMGQSLSNFSDFEAHSLTPAELVRKLFKMVKVGYSRMKAENSTKRLKLRYEKSK